MCMHTHYARYIELLHAAEVINDLLHDPSLQDTELVRKGEKKQEGVGVLEAPRGTLFHHYRINDNDQIVMANLIVSTTNNNEPMNRAVNYVAKARLSGKKEITEPMTNAIEVAIRAYDPCLSCATHALGQMITGDFALRCGWKFDRSKGNIKSNRVYFVSNAFLFHF